jgi:hypothetical protein
MLPPSVPIIAKMQPGFDSGKSSKEHMQAAVTVVPDSAKYHESDCLSAAPPAVARSHAHSGSTGEDFTIVARLP